MPQPEDPQDPNTTPDPEQDGRLVPEPVASTPTPAIQPAAAASSAVTVAKKPESEPEEPKDEEDGMLKIYLMQLSCVIVYRN